MPEQEKQVRDTMIDVFEFPHVPYWFTLRQVSGILKKAIHGGKCLRPPAALVFDEKYNLLGYLDLQDILQSIGNASLAGEKNPPDIFSSSNAETTRILSELSEQPVSSLLHQTRLFADPEDLVSKAAELMLRNSLPILPVLENQKKLVGIVRSTEIFEYLSAAFFRA